MANTGAYPINTATAVGLFRVQVGDTEPVTDNGDDTANYQFFSDDELTAVLTDTGGGDAGMASAYRKLAAILALKAVQITTDDLRYASEQRAETMRKIAADYQSAADKATNNTDIFELAFAFNCETKAELAEGYWPY